MDEGKKLYWFTTSPGDPDHLPSYYFEAGVVEAEPAEIEALTAALAEEHGDLFSITPLEEQTKSLDELRIAVGSALNVYHGELQGNEPCATDAPFIAAYKKDMFG